MKTDAANLQLMLAARRAGRDVYTDTEGRLRYARDIPKGGTFEITWDELQRLRPMTEAERFRCWLKSIGVEPGQA